MSDSNSFTSAEVTQIIVAGLQSGAIVLPFSRKFNVEKFNQKLGDHLKNPGVGNGGTLEEKYEEFTSKRLAYQLGGLARMDAIYVLCLKEALLTGLTDKETERIIDAATSEFV